MNVLFVCGGSAGHINPALAIAEELRSRLPDCNILFIGADKSLEKRLIPNAGFPLENIKMTGLNRGIKPRDIVHNIKTVVNLIKANAKAKKIIKEFSPNAVIGTGGYICYPVLKKAAKYGIPTYILEPNAYPGLAVRMLSPIVDKIFVTYKGMENAFKRPEGVVVFTGTPLQKKFLESIHDSGTNNITDSGKPLVVSFWGSLGASEMNKMMLQFIKRNAKEKKFKHIHATGINSNKDQIVEELSNMGIDCTNESEIDVREYINNMPAVMNEATVIMSRAGATTIAELTALGKPAILIPSPNVPDNHQEKNARRLEESGGVVMIKECDCTADKLFDLVTSLIEDKVKLEEMSKAQESQSIHNASEKIVNIIIDEAGMNKV